jgi:phospholipid/cholesterol/gamma-HCH transport system substrate-binding protein
LIENSAGLGMEYKFLRRNLRLGLDAFDFSADRPHLRGSVRYNLVYGLFLTGGADDFLNKNSYSTYIGAGLDLTNDDVTMLFSKVPF